MSDTLCLYLSEDAWTGNAQASVSLDGAALTPAPVPVTVAHSAGTTSQTLAFSGSWGGGRHALTLTLVNPASGGTAATTRTLYLDGVQYNGALVSSTTVTLTGKVPVGIAFVGPSASAALLVS